MPNILSMMMGAAGAGGVSEYQLWAWGSNSEGQLGQGNETSRCSPVQVGDNFMGEIDIADEGIIATSLRISIAYNSAAAVKGDGTLWTWGDSDQGKLGLGDTTKRSSPTQVGSLTNWRSVLMGHNSCCATKTDGTLWGWGHGGGTEPELSGQTSDVSSPVQIGSDTDWGPWLAYNAQSSGWSAESAIGIKTNGQLYQWGNIQSAFYAQGGYPYEAGVSNTLYTIPPKAIDDKAYIAASASRGGVWAIEKDTGKLWAWGVNAYGKLGTGNTTSISSPVQIGTATDWVGWVTGSEQGEMLMASKSNGEIWTAGRNDAGPMGLENTTAYSSPVQIGGPGNWQTGGHGQAPAFTHAITDANGDNTGGALWAIGGSTCGHGVNGTGTNDNFSSPVQVGSDTDWIAVTAQGSYNSCTKLAIKKAS